MSPRRSRYMLPLADCFGLLLAAPAWCAAPAVIWASDPVRPGETVVVRGDAFGSQARVEVLTADRATWSPTEVFQQTDRTLMFLLPASARPGITSFRVVTGEGTSPAVVLNGASGVIARNRIAAVPTQWSVLGRKTHYRRGHPRHGGGGTGMTPCFMSARPISLSAAPPPKDVTTPYAGDYLKNANILP